MKVIQTSPVMILEIDKLELTPKHFTGILVEPDGSKYHYLNGKLHCDSEAAYNCILDGEIDYYLYGKEYPFSEWIEAVKIIAAIRSKRIQDIVSTLMGEW